tara:strand:+ start:9080 stop:11407 length:2328 start_codon:yes stop_codon:yes gene_type:complete
MENELRINRFWGIFIYFGVGVTLGLFLREVAKNNLFLILWPENLISAIILGISIILVVEFILYWSIDTKKIFVIFSFDHAKSYFPLFLLLAVYLTNKIPLSGFYKDFALYYYVTTLFGLSISFVLFFKIYFLTTKDTLKYFTNMKSKGRTLSIVFPFQKVIVLLMLISTIYFFCILLLSNRALTDDSWYYFNMIWNLSKLSFSYSGGDLDIPTHIFGQHLNLILIPVALLFKIWPNIDFLILLQSLVISSAIIPLAFLGKEKTGSSMIGFTAGLSYLLHPAIQIAHNWGLVVDVWGTSALIWAYYYLENNKINLFMLFCFLSMACKEILAIPVFGFGIWVLFKKNNFQLALFIIIISLLWFIGSIYIKNYLNNGVDLHANFSYKLVYLLSHPVKLVKHYFVPIRVLTVFQIMLSVGFICLANPFFMILSFPLLAIIYLGEWHNTQFIRNYYFAPVVPFFIISAIYGVNKVKKILKTKENILPALSIYWIGIAILSFIFYNPFHHFSRYSDDEHSDTPHKKMTRSILSNIPRGKSVSVTPELRFLVSNRKYVYIFPKGQISSSTLNKHGLKPIENYSTRDADYVIIDLQQNSHSKYSVGTPEIQNIVNNSKYGLHFIHDGLMIFEREKSKEEGLKNVFINHDQIKGIKINKTFGNGMKLLAMESSYKSGLKQGDGLDITLYWQAISKQSVNFRVLLSFAHNELKTKEFMHTPIFNLIEPKDWPIGCIIKDSFIVPISDTFIIHYEPYQVYIDVLGDNQVVSTESRIKLMDTVNIVP